MPCHHTAQAQPRGEDADSDPKPNNPRPDVSFGSLTTNLEVACERLTQISVRTVVLAWLQGRTFARFTRA